MNSQNLNHGDFPRDEPESRNDLEKEKLRLEIEELKKGWWKRPGYIGAVLPSLLALFTVVYALANGYFNLESKRLEVESISLGNRIYEFKQDSIRLSNLIDSMDNAAQSAMALADSMSKEASRAELKHRQKIEEQGQTIQYWKDKYKKDTSQLNDALRLARLRNDAPEIVRLEDRRQHTQERMDRIERGDPEITDISTVFQGNSTFLVIYGANFDDTGRVHIRYTQSEYERRDISPLTYEIEHVPVYQERSPDEVFQYDRVFSWTDGIIEIRLAPSEYEKYFAFSIAPQRGVPRLTDPIPREVTRVAQVMVKTRKGVESPWFPDVPYPIGR